MSVCSLAMMGRRLNSAPNYNQARAALKQQGQVARCRLQLTLDTSCPQVFGVEEGIDTINDTYWTLRVEATPTDQLQLMPHDRLIHVYHVTLDTQQHVGLAA